MCIDLHVHSVYSDGTATPRELIQLAVQNRLTGVALTDHDTMAGVAEMVLYGKKAGIDVLAGIEIGAMHGERSLHILAYGIDPENGLFNNWLDRLQKGRVKRNLKILQKLRDMGIHISHEELERFSRCGQVGRPHIAGLLMHKGIVHSMDQAFTLYLGRGKPAWQRRFCYTATESITMIHQCGGLAVLAHPGQLDPALRIQPRLLAELHERHLDGLEVYYPSHTRKMRKILLALAARYNLLATGGSDYHGGNRPGTTLAGGKNGFCPPGSILVKLQTQLLAARNATATEKAVPRAV